MLWLRPALFVALLCLVVVDSFVVPCQRPGLGPTMSSAQGPASSPVTRGDLLKAGGTFFAFSFVSPNPTWARGLPTGPSKSELLEKTRNKDTEDPVEKKARLAALRKERLERQRQLDAEEEARKNDPNRKEVDIDANLRASYYYPTAQKRYLPRVKAAADALPAAKASLQAGQWDKVEAYANTEADNAALPLKLYASSLTGQGLSLDVSYVKVLNTQAEVYGKELETFKKAVKAKDAGKALSTLDRMEAALALYRKTARIDKADGGVGEFPTDSKLGASFANNNPSLYKKRGKE